MLALYIVQVQCTYTVPCILDQRQRDSLLLCSPQFHMNYCNSSCRTYRCTVHTHTHTHVNSSLNKCPLLSPNRWSTINTKASWPLASSFTDNLRIRWWGFLPFTRRSKSMQKITSSHAMGNSITFIVSFVSCYLPCVCPVFNWSWTRQWTSLPKQPAYTSKQQKQVLTWINVRKVVNLCIVLPIWIP